MDRFLIGAGLAALLLAGCGPNRTGPEIRDTSACANFTGCGECAGQPQCGWCVVDGVGRCIGNAAEDDRETTPSACTGSWHYRIADDPALPAGEAPYCPAVASAGDEAPVDAVEEQTTEGEEAP